MRARRLVFSVLVFGLTAFGAPIRAGAQDSTKRAPAAPKKAPSKVTKVVKKLADTAATTAAGMAVDTLLGQKGRAVAGALTGTAAVNGASCPAGFVAVPTGASALAPGQLPGPASAGAAMVAAAKKAVKTRPSADSGKAVAAAAAAAPAGGQIPAFTCQPAGMPAGAATAAPGMPGMPSPLGMMAAATPIGMAATAAPLAGKAAKGIKGMFGGKPQDKIAMLRELGKGRLELKDVKFIEGTAEFEPGFEASFTTLGEALGLAEGTYIIHVPAEQGEKGAPPDTALARKRLEKAWAALLASGVPDQRVIAAAVLPPALAAGRKPPKAGEARVEFIRMTEKP
jgi:hypothetical protein